MREVGDVKGEVNLDEVSLRTQKNIVAEIAWTATNNKWPGAGLSETTTTVVFDEVGDLGLPEQYHLGDFGMLMIEMNLGRGMEETLFDMTQSGQQDFVIFFALLQGVFQDIHETGTVPAFILRVLFECLTFFPQDRLDILYDNAEAPLVQMKEASGGDWAYQGQMAVRSKRKSTKRKSKKKSTKRKLVKRKGNRKSKRTTC